MLEKLSEKKRVKKIIKVYKNTVPPVMCDKVPPVREVQNL